MNAEKIEFRCSHCDRLLRVPAIHRGKWLACPGCTTEIKVLDDSHPDDQDHSSDEDSDDEDFDVVTWDPQVVPLSEIFRDTWQLYIQNLWLLLGVALIDLLIYVIGLVLVMIPTGIAMILLVQLGPPVAAMAGLLIGGLGLLTLVNYMMCRHAIFFLKVARGEPCRLTEALRLEFRSGTHTFLPLIFGVIVTVGMLMFVVPGVYVYLTMWPYVWVWADRQTPKRSIEAFQLSRELTRSNLGPSFVIAILVFVGSFLGQAEIFTGSFVRLLKAVAYLKMSGQSIGVRRD